VAPEVGRHSYVSDPSLIKTRVTLGNFTSVAPGVQMHGRVQHACITQPDLASTSTHKHIPGYPPPTHQDLISIGSDVWIGQQAVLLGGITVGHGAIVGAFAVIAKDVQPYTVVVGNPAITIRSRFDRTTIGRLLDLRWWDWPDDVIAERAEELRDVRALLAMWG
jgi:acetyltransferase-like isoleucine patch superfamily enzyme